MGTSEILAQKWDKTLESFIVKSGMGLGIGLAASLLLFRRRAWPIAGSLGFAWGIAYEESKQAFDIFKTKATLK